MKKYNPDLVYTLQSNKISESLHEELLEKFPKIDDFDYDEGDNTINVWDEDFSVVRDLSLAIKELSPNSKIVVLRYITKYTDEGLCYYIIYKLIRGKWEYKEIAD